MDWLAKFLHWLLAKRDTGIVPPREPRQEDHPGEADSSIGPVAIIRTREWKPFDGPLDAMPTNRREVYEMFGNPGSGSVNPKWRKENIETYRDLPGIPRKWYFQFHRLCEPYLREGLRRAQIASPEHVITRAAGFVFRHMRHDSSQPLSMHSFGIAADFNPKENSAKWFRPRGTAPEAWSDQYWDIWPKGLPRPWTEAMQSVGFAWGGDWDEDGSSVDHTFFDGMHFEWIDRSRGKFPHKV